MKSWDRVSDLVKAYLDGDASSLAVLPEDRSFLDWVKGHRVGYCLPPSHPAFSDLRQFHQCHSLQLLSVLFTALDALDTAGIDVMLLKGPVLSVLLYGDVGCRWYRDLDLWVSPDDLVSAHCLLVSSGFVAMSTEASPDWVALRASSKDLSYCHEASGVVLELHFALSPSEAPFQLDWDVAWSSRQTVMVSGRYVETLSSEWTLVYLCYHGAEHQWRRLQWLLDVAQWRRCYDWNETVLALADQAGARRDVFQALFLMASIWQIPLPDGLRDERPSFRMKCLLMFTRRIMRVFPSTQDPWSLMMWRFFYMGVLTSSSWSLFRAVKTRLFRRFQTRQ